MRTLLIENYQPLVRAIKRGLEGEGFSVDVARTLEEAGKKVGKTAYDGLVLDLARPEEDGLGQLQRWRRAGLQTHVLVLTAQGSLEARVRSLDMGADDCLSKPFAFDELLARLRALGRRRGETPDPVLRVADLEINTAARTVRRGDQNLYLTPREYSLLQLLAHHRGKVVTRSMIVEHLYNGNSDKSSNVIDVYIRYLRNKIDKGFATQLILTRWGQGYLLRGEES